MTSSWHRNCGSRMEWREWGEGLRGEGDKTNQLLSPWNPEGALLVYICEFCKLQSSLVLRSKDNPHGSNLEIIPIRNQPIKLNFLSNIGNDWYIVCRICVYCLHLLCVVVCCLCVVGCSFCQEVGRMLQVIVDDASHYLLPREPARGGTHQLATTKVRREPD